MAVEVPEVSAEDITIMAASQPDAGIQSIIVGLLFGTVVALLLVVTGGVAYINIKQWLDARQEKEDRDKEKAAPAAAASSSAAKSSGKEEDPNAVVPLKRANRIKKEKGKGFAAADQFTSRR
ncbi:hypothetical protein CHLRE_06g303700v5 [Chlamydomonas reinhardtii]|uniref:Uncharacterized protein n=1 Tax=Chlamydomonas reinhardtii TaxID=3055 RepID=A0A2K3DR63_CHLRE|nr:uncharacterized protein CHLRE_06g303700v5 [Chlamydomonas reinhardtii]PNW83029.1 hypothetical protein CHLRE_06g303700v5 [Chlamydomonas reinhardtii]